jgi:CDP-2,3-bis-(O-geranylgeranyl)-sn-glycerol synthase
VQNILKHIHQDPNLDIKDIHKVELFVGISLLILAVYIIVWTALYSIYDCLVIMGLAFFGLVPSLITNALMPLVSNFKGFKRYPMDGGRFHKDGERLLGDGKSWNGFILGTILGFIISALLSSQIYPWLATTTVESFKDGTVLQYVSEDHILFFVGITADPLKFYLGQFLLCLGTPLGDVIGSYYKRRKKVKRGEVFLFWDQNDFIICSITIAYFFFPMAWYYIIFLLVITPILTVSANIFSYYIGKKTVPW